jgi:hypothetical protein
MKSFTIKVLLGLVVAACFLPTQVKAQGNANSIDTFVACVNGKATVADAVACLPTTGCFFTNTMSRESAQPACTLRDGTKLPRVIFSCPGPNGDLVLRFRPSFSLCTQGGTNPVIDHIELGQDMRKNTTDDPGFAGFGIQFMADILVKPGATYTLSGVLDTPTSPKGCNDCHDQFRTAVLVTTTANTFGPIPPELAEGTLSSNDPFVQATSGADLSAICAGISASLTSGQLKTSPNGPKALALCNALNNKEH